MISPTLLAPSAADKDFATLVASPVWLTSSPKMPPSARIKNQEVQNEPAPSENVFSKPSQKSSPLVTRIIAAVTTDAVIISTPLTIITISSAIAMINPIADNISIPPRISSFFVTFLYLHRHSKKSLKMSPFRFGRCCVPLAHSTLRQWDFCL